MLMPSIFGEDLFDDLMDFPFERDSRRRAAAGSAYGKADRNLMRTDIRETDNSFELDIDLPGYKKEDVTAQLENGYLTISAPEVPVRTKRIKKANISAGSVLPATAPDAFM